MATIDKPLPNVDNDKAQEEIVEIENKKAAEVIDTPTGPVEVAMDEMGGAEVSFDPNAVNIDPTQDHFANLAETLDDGVLDDRSVTIDMADNGVLVFHGKDGSSVLGSKDDTTPTAGEEAWGDVTGATALTIGNDKVTTAKILDANVTTSKIADNNITTAKILDDNITTAKI